MQGGRKETAALRKLALNEGTGFVDPSPGISDMKRFALFRCAAFSGLLSLSLSDTILSNAVQFTNIPRVYGAYGGAGEYGGPDSSCIDLCLFVWELW